MAVPLYAAESAASYEVAELTAPRTAELRQGGRIVIPVEFRRALDIQEGDKLLIRLEDGALRITTRRAQIDAARRKFNEAFPQDDGRDWSAELIAERRAEAGGE